MSVVTSVTTTDLRFPTSRYLDGSDAMNPDPDYSAAYVVLETDDPTSLAGHAFAFTIGRGNDIQTAAIQALAPLVVGRSVDSIIGELGAFGRQLVDDSQFRWLGPEKGVMHMAIGAIVNAAWDMRGRRDGMPIWRVISAMEPEEIAALIDFRYLGDVLTEGEALTILRNATSGKDERIADLLANGYPAYTTSPGWLGYSDTKLVEEVERALSEGFTTIKLKVGRDIDDDLRRCKIIRRVAGWDIAIAVDANQSWGVEEAVEWIVQLAEFDIAWVEEPTHPDDVLGHAAIRRRLRNLGASVRISTGEHTPNQIAFKQFFVADAIDLVHIDAARVGGVNENLAILLLACKFGIPVYPHAGGVGLCELVQHLAMADYVAISGRNDDRAIEYVEHLHEHFVSPVRVERGRYVPPTAPGFSAEICQDALQRYAFPYGATYELSS
jgi:L-fuconate dehydratase